MESPDKVSIPGLPAEMSDWMADSKYARFWQHYQEMQTWMEEYATSWKQSGSQFQSKEQAAAHPYQISQSATQGYEPQNWPYMHPVTHNVIHAPQTVRRTSQRNTAHKQQHHASTHGKTHHRNIEDQEIAMEWNEENGEEDSFELEVSEEWKEFFAKSEEFRRKRDKAKKSGQLFKGEISKKVAEQQGKTESELTTSESESQEEVQLETCAPKERPGVRRIVEMKELYGRHAAAIHGMETAVQLQFDRNCDRKQPAYWPIVPLKM